MSINDNCWWLRRSSSCNGAKRCVKWFLLVLSCTLVAAEMPWEHPGCHLIDNFTQTMSPTNCVGFQLTTKVCIGFCPSRAVVTSSTDLAQNPNQVVTSVASCCDMVETEDIRMLVQCVSGIRDFTFKSAKSCKCSQCKKDFN